MDFRILGPLEVADGTGRILALGGAKQRALLAILLLNANQVVAAERLVDDLWGEDAPMTASNALQVYVSQLRKVLRVDLGSSVPTQIVTRPPGYVLEVAGPDFDLTRFEDLAARGREALMVDEFPRSSVLLRSALALWRGGKQPGCERADGCGDRQLACLGARGSATHTVRNGGDNGRAAIQH